MLSTPKPLQTGFPASCLRVLLGDVFLGFLAIVAGVLTLAPVVFKISDRTDALLEWGQWAIVLLFAVEYGVGFAKAPSKQRFVLSPWRIIDLATIVIPLLTFVPGTSELFRSTPMLRLVRLARVFALGVRASGVMVREEKAAIASQKEGPVQVCMLPTSGSGAPRLVSWDEFVRWAKQPGSDWFSITNVGPHNVADLAGVTGLTPELITTHLLAASYPRVESVEHYVSLFVWVPERPAAGPTERRGVLLLAGDKSVVTLSRKSTSALEKINPMQSTLEGVSFPVNMVCRLLKNVLDANESLVAQFEAELSQLEELPVRESRQQFFERTFRLKKELSAAQADLWRLRGVIRELAEGRVKLPGGEAAKEYLHDLTETADYLYETVNNVRDGVLSLIELHLNVVSFEMNRVMRVLAVVSVLGLIPGVVGGLLGMNLSDNPWPLTLPQVTFGVGTAMVTCLYFFVVKGWLR